MRHKVSCAVCGKKGIVDINDKTRRIVGREWYYYKKLDVNWEKTEKYLYRVISFKPKLLTKRCENPKYDKTAKPKLVEHWECRKCNNE